MCKKNKYEKNKLWSAVKIVKSYRIWQVNARQCTGGAKEEGLRDEVSTSGATDRDNENDAGSGQRRAFCFSGFCKFLLLASSFCG